MKKGTEPGRKPLSHKSLQLPLSHHTCLPRDTLVSRWLRTSRSTETSWRGLGPSTVALGEEKKSPLVVNPPPGLCLRNLKQTSRQLRKRYGRIRSKATLVVGTFRSPLSRRDCPESQVIVDCCQQWWQFKICTQKINIQIDVARLTFTSPACCYYNTWWLLKVSNHFTRFYVHIYCSIL